MIDELKKKLPDRSLHLVSFENVVDCLAVDPSMLKDGTEFEMIMTGASPEELQRCVDEVRAAREALRSAMLHAVLAQVQWPEHEEARKFFEAHPEQLDDMEVLLHRHADATADRRAAKRR